MHMLKSVILMGTVCTMATASAAVKQPPRLLKPGEYRIGRMIEDVSFTSIDGKTGRLSDSKNSDALVIAFTGVGCPLTKKFAPELAAIEDEVVKQKVAFIYVNSTGSDRPDEQLTMARTHGFDGPVIHDVKGMFGRALGALTTTDVFVLDKARTLVYRGAVSDQYGIGFNNDTAKNAYLKDAIAATLRSERAPVEATWAPGCALDFEEPAKLVSNVT